MSLELTGESSTEIFHVFTGKLWTETFAHLFLIDLTFRKYLLSFVYGCVTDVSKCSENMFELPNYCFLMLMTETY